MAINTVELGWIQRLIIDGDIVQIQALYFRVFLGRFQLFVSIPHFGFKFKLAYILWGQRDFFVFFRIPTLLFNC